MIWFSKPTLRPWLLDDGWCTVRPSHRRLSALHDRVSLSPPGGDMRAAQQWSKGESRRRQSSENVASCCCSSLWDLLSTFQTPHMTAQTRSRRWLAMFHLQVPRRAAAQLWVRVAGLRHRPGVTLAFVCRTQLERQVAAVDCGAFGGFFLRQKCGPECSRCVFRWICARLRNERSGEDPAALPAALLLRSRAARCHVDQSDPPGTRWDTYLQTTLISFSSYSALLVCT